MVATFLEERDIARRGREAREWLTRDERGREVARRGREAREWLTHDERGRIVGLIVVSVAISIAMSLVATALVGFVQQRRAMPAAPEAETIDGALEAATEAGDATPAGVPVMDAAIPADPVEGQAPVEA